MIRKLSFLLLVSYLIATASSPALAQTRPFDPGRGEVVAPSPGAVADVATIKGLEAVFYNVVVVILSLAGIMLFLALISNGFKYLTSGSDQEGAQAAKQGLTYAFIGFVILVAAYLILKLIQSFTGVTLNEFRVTQ